MKKIFLLLTVSILCLMSGCSNNKVVKLQGTYQYISGNAEVYQMTID